MGMVPVISIMSTEVPVRQMAMITFVGLCSWLISYCQVDKKNNGWFLEPIWNTMNIAVKFLTWWMMACGLITCCLDYFHSSLGGTLPAALLSVSLIAFIPYLVYKWRNTPFLPDRRLVLASDNVDNDNVVEKRGYLSN